VKYIILEQYREDDEWRTIYHTSQNLEGAIRLYFYINETHNRYMQIYEVNGSISEIEKHPMYLKLKEISEHAKKIRSISEDISNSKINLLHKKTRYEDLMSHINDECNKKLICEIEVLGNDILNLEKSLVYEQSRNK